MITHQIHHSGDAASIEAFRKMKLMEDLVKKKDRLLEILSHIDPTNDCHELLCLVQVLVFFSKIYLSKLRIQRMKIIEMEKANETPTVTPKRDLAPAFAAAGVKLFPLYSNGIPSK